MRPTSAIELQLASGGGAPGGSRSLRTFSQRV
jgi:hypothetical protein